MKPSEPRFPLLRRLIGPLAILLSVTGTVFLLSRLGIPTTSAKEEEKNYGALVIGIAAALVMTRLLDYLLFEVGFLLRRKLVAPALLRQLVSLAVFGFCLAILFKVYLSVSLAAVLTTSAIITAVVGLALQDTLGNLFAGLALHLEKTVEVGDMVRSGETFGKVEELSWRAIKLRTMEGNLLLIPNSVAGRERLEIYPRSGRSIARTLRVALDYDASPALARDTLEAAVRNLPGLAAFPEPLLYMKSYDDHAIAYELRYWLEDYARYLEVDSQVRERVWYALDRAGLKVAYPVVRQHQWAAGPLARPSRREAIAQAIDRVDLFAPLTPQERECLVDGARECRYAAGEIIVREGEKTSSMFLVESGRAGVSIHGGAGDSQKLAVLEPGAAFGEISLLTGEPRSATVRSLTETTLIEIDKETLGPILVANPALVEALEVIMKERRQRASDLLDAMRAEVEPMHDRAPLAGRIARFFGLRARG